MMISSERTEQLDIFCHITGFMSDFFSFIDVELIRFFHGAIQLRRQLSKYIHEDKSYNNVPHQPKIVTQLTHKHDSL